jgi:hypothetical protein
MRSANVQCHIYHMCSIHLKSIWKLYNRIVFEVTKYLCGVLVFLWRLQCDLSFLNISRTKQQNENQKGAWQMVIQWGFRSSYGPSLLTNYSDGLNSHYLKHYKCWLMFTTRKTLNVKNKIFRECTNCRQCKDMQRTNIH